MNEPRRLAQCDGHSHTVNRVFRVLFQRRDGPRQRSEEVGIIEPFFATSHIMAY